VSIEVGIEANIDNQSKLFSYINSKILEWIFDGGSTRDGFSVAQVRLEWKCLTATNALAYYGTM
jgi:hypothetical protein